jgi:hypothetical protein
MPDLMLGANQDPIALVRQERQLCCSNLHGDRKAAMPRRPVREPTLNECYGASVSANKASVNDAIIVAVCRLVDDAQSGTREPSHSDLEFKINRAGLSGGDPKGQGQVVGKAKRVRAVLSWGSTTRRTRRRRLWLPSSGC